MTAAPAVAFSAAIQIKPFNDNVVARKRPIAARVGRAEDRPDWCACRRSQMHGAGIASDENLRSLREREELFERSIEGRHSSGTCQIDNLASQPLFTRPICHD